MTTASIYMNLPVPVVGQEPGPEWATDLNNSLTIIDQHNHTSGQGVQIPSAGLNINADLSFNDNNLIDARSLRLYDQNSALNLGSDLRCLYAVAADLYYNDGAGNQVRITQSGGVAGSPGSIANLTSPASASYVSASTKFVWESDSNTAAVMDAGPLIIRKLVASSPGLTLSAPSSMSVDYSLSLPALPLSTSFVSLDSSGNFGTPIPVSLGITAANLASNSVTTAKIADVAVTQAKKAIRVVTADGTDPGAGGLSSNGSSGFFPTNSTTFGTITNATVTLTSLGNPIQVGMRPFPHSGVTGEYSRIYSAGQAGFIRLLRDGLEIARWFFGYANSDAVAVNFGPSMCDFTDLITAGTYVYTYQIALVSSGFTVGVENVQTIAFEL